MSPECMALATVRPLLRGTFGEPWLWHEACASTQDLLRDPTLPEGAVAIAEHQTSGRGRLGRVWEDAPSLGLLVSVLLRPPAVDVLPQLSLVAGLATAEALEAVAGVETVVKWPNDVLVADRKVAGILLEAVGGAVIAGIGVNVNQSEDDLPERPRTPATSLRLASGTTISRAQALATLLDRLEMRYREWCEHGLGPLLPALEARNALRGRRAHAGGLVGGIGGFAPDGRLQLVVDDRVVLVGSGEIELV